MENNMLRRTHVIRGFLVVNAVIFLYFLGTPAFPIAETAINDIIMAQPNEGQFQITICGTGDLNLEQSKSINNPNRLYFDFGNTTLKYNKGQTKRIPVGVLDLESIAVSQYQTNPNTVRIVMYFKGTQQEFLNNTVTTDVKNHNFIITYTSNVKKLSDSPKLQADGFSGSQKPGNVEFNVIDKIFYKGNGDTGDSFIFQAPDNFTDPEVKITPLGMTLDFAETHFKIPLENIDNYQIPVKSKVIDEMQVTNEENGSVAFLSFNSPMESSNFRYEISRQDDNRMVLELSWAENPISPEKSNQKVADSKPVQGELRDLFSANENAGGQSNQPLPSSVVSITKIQYFPLSIGERFIITASGDLKPEILMLKYPDRLSIKAKGTTVVLPDLIDGRFQMMIDGAITKSMQVFLNKVDNSFDSLILLQFEIRENEEINYRFYPSNIKNVYYLDIIPDAFLDNQTRSAEPLQSSSDSSEPVIEKTTETEHLSIERGDQFTSSDSSTHTRETTINPVPIPVADDSPIKSLASVNIPKSDDSEPTEQTAGVQEIETIGTTPFETEENSKIAVQMAFTKGKDFDEINIICDEPVFHTSQPQSIAA
jgi:hypothetical protein